MITKILMSVFFLLPAFALSAEKLEFKDAHIFALLKSQTVTAGYVLVKNKTKQTVILKISKASPFKVVETHESIQKEGRMSMKKIEAFTIPAESTLEMKPGGNHIMFFEPTRAIKLGEKISVQFIVDGQIQTVEFHVVQRTE